jgi:hypothetical protein
MPYSSAHSSYTRSSARRRAPLSRFPTDRHGVALLFALIAIALLSALSLATLTYTNNYVRTSALFANHIQAFATAEYTLWKTVPTLTPVLLHSLPAHTTIQAAPHVSVTKLTPTLFWLVSSGPAPSHHRLGITAMLSTSPPDTVARLHPIPQYAWVDLY